MKTNYLMIMAVLPFLFSSACSKEEVKLESSQKVVAQESEEDDPFDLSDLEIHLDGIVLVKKYKLDQRDEMFEDISSFIWEGGVTETPVMTINDPEEINGGELQIRKIDPANGNPACYAVSAVDGGDVSSLAEPCDETFTKTCSSEECVSETVSDIYSVDRDVKVSYEKVNFEFSRKITWTYQDC